MQLINGQIFRMSKTRPCEHLPIEKARCFSIYLVRAPFFLQGPFFLRPLIFVFFIDVYLDTSSFDSLFSRSSRVDFPLCRVFLYIVRQCLSFLKLSLTSILFGYFGELPSFSSRIVVEPVSLDIAPFVGEVLLLVL